jgi:hypothetical protein
MTEKTLTAINCRILIMVLEQAKAVIEDIGQWKIGTEMRSDILHDINEALALAKGEMR